MLYLRQVMKMLKKETEQRQAIEMLCTDMLVPKGHLQRKIDAAVNFTRIYEMVEDLYCEDNGRPSCDPVVLFKLVVIQHLFGIPFSAADHAGCGSECGLPMVSGVHPVAAAAALCNHQLRIPASIQL